MKEVYFKQIMIADLQNKTARVQPLFEVVSRVMRKIVYGSGRNLLQGAA